LADGEVVGCYEESEQIVRIILVFLLILHAHGGLPGQEPGKDFRVSIAGDDYDMQWVPPGEFKQPATEGIAETEGEAHPSRYVKLDYGFWISRKCISRKSFMSVCRPINAAQGMNGDVQQIAFAEAEAFCKYAIILTMLRYRIPTEAEWDWAIMNKAITPRSMEFTSEAAIKRTGDAITNPFNAYQTWKNQYRTVIVRGPTVAASNSFAEYWPQGSISFRLVLEHDTNIHQNNNKPFKGPERKP